MESILTGNQNASSFAPRSHCESAGELAMMTHTTEKEIPHDCTVKPKTLNLSKCHFLPSAPRGIKTEKTDPVLEV